MSSPCRSFGWASAGLPFLESPGCLEFVRLEIDLKMNLSILKPLQAGIEMGTAELPPLDPFDEVGPIIKGRKEVLDYDFMAALSINKDRLVE